MNIAFVFCAAVCLVSLPQDTETQRLSPPDDALKTQAYAFVGAVRQKDWAYVYDHSTDDFRNAVLYKLLLADGLFINESLTRTIEKFVDLKALNSKENHGKSKGKKTLSEVWLHIEPCIVDKKKLFVEGLKSIDNQLQVPDDVRLPKTIVGIKKNKQDATVTIEYDNWRYVKRDSKRELVKSGTKKSSIPFCKKNNVWMVTSDVFKNQTRFHDWSF